MSEQKTDARQITAKHDGNCLKCKVPLKEGERIFYNPNGQRGQKVTCLKCGDVWKDGNDNSFQQSGSDPKGSLAGLKGKTDEELIDFILKNQKSVKGYFESHNMVDNGFDSGQILNLLILVKVANGMI